ncbi:PREDICTED: solute carrier family 41 member 1-like isoform X2 [Eufriesea mexicana]|uniref:solute carrier family 41 member 1-like isoform X2 n=1 Tax=Eufriesea mexicana TaxID=516756 RepID=UPI00083BF9C4|nr:PREDICTED: solute carrier family 41 member 1-like isoform X2 [Eufriesea mexicana]
MSNANIGMKVQENNLSNIRHRKSEKKFCGNEMVGLDSDESLRSNIYDIIMEVEMKTDEETESDGETTQRLIPSPISHQCINDDTKKIVTRSSQFKQFEDENVCSMSIQMFVPFLLAGFGMVAASMLLDVLQHWPVYKTISEVYILVPALLGLKGNLEMTLASRFSTHANLGHMNTRKQKWTLIIGNLALIQCQATVINIDPDNIATPIAASLGDLTTLMLLSGIASLLFEAADYASWIAPLLITFHIIVTPVWYYIAAKNHFTKEILNYGWTPVICAMLISSMGGLILDYTVSNYKGIAVFQLVINGVGGNLAAVQASRISTSLHKDHRANSQEIPAIRFNPFYIFCTKGGHARTARVLLTMVIPGHLIFGYTISYLQAGHTSFTPIFLIVYLTAAVIQVILLLYITQLMVVWMWIRGMDPDSSAIPYLTAAGDLLGTALLGIAFHFLYAIGDGDSDVGD